MLARNGSQAITAVDGPNVIEIATSQQVASTGSSPRGSCRKCAAGSRRPALCTLHPALKMLFVSARVLRVLRGHLGLPPVMPLKPGRALA